MTQLMAIMNDTNPTHLWQHRRCEVCQSNQPRLLFAQRFVPLSEGSLLTGYDVVVCQQCGFCYADHLPGQEAFDAYYRDMSKYEQPVGSGRPSQYELDRFEATVKRIEKFLPDRNEHIFEIGCATGLLLAQLKSAGYRNVTGLDPSPACSRAAEQLYGIKVHCGALSADLAEAGNIDLLILVGVLEHLRDLRGALDKMSGLLGSGGRIFVTVPDASEYAAGDDAPFQEFSLEHINYFGPQSLANLMAVHGFRCLSSEQGLQRVNARTVTPVIHGVFEKTGTKPSDVTWRKDAITQRGLERYIAKSECENAAIQPVLEELSATQEPVIIWGAGSHTLRLLGTSQLANANLRAIVDSNPRYQGKRVQGVPIVKPEAIRDMPGAILVSSRVFQQNICKQIQESLKLDHRVVTLYELDNELCAASL
jgi:SAM-dependent methyltransferase